MIGIIDSDRLSRLSDELLLEVLSYLDASDILNLQRAARRFYDIGVDSLFWTKLCRRDFGSSHRKVSAIGLDNYRVNSNWDKGNFTTSQYKVCCGIKSFPAFAYHRGWGCLVYREYSDSAETYTTWKIRCWSIEDPSVAISVIVRDDAEDVILLERGWAVDPDEREFERLLIMVDSTCTSKHEVNLLLLWADAKTTRVHLDTRGHKLVLQHGTRATDTDFFFRFFLWGGYNLRFAQSQLALVYDNKVLILEANENYVWRCVFSHEVYKDSLHRGAIAIEWRRENERLILGLAWTGDSHPKNGPKPPLQDINTMDLVVSHDEQGMLSWEFLEQNTALQVDSSPRPVGDDGHYEERRFGIHYEHPIIIVTEFGFNHIYDCRSSTSRAPLDMRCRRMRNSLWWTNRESRLQCLSRGRWRSNPSCVIFYPLVETEGGIHTYYTARYLGGYIHRSLTARRSDDRFEDYRFMKHEVESTWVDDEKTVSLINARVWWGKATPETIWKLPEDTKDGEVFSYIHIRDFTCKSNEVSN